MEKAQELMREYSITVSAADTADIESMEVKTGSRGRRAPVHEARLMNAVAKAFGCRRAYGYTDGGGWYKVHEFIGPDHRVRIASYVAEVLLRRLRRARSSYMKSLYRVRKRYTKTCRADEFCRGWVFTVTGKLAEIKNSPDEEKALDEYERSLGWTARKISPARSGENKGDWTNGCRAGKNAEIQGGVGAFGGRLSQEAPS
jgi:hypothetical protein